MAPSRIWERRAAAAALAVALVTSSPAWSQEAEGDNDVLVEGERMDARAPSAFRTRIDVGRLVAQGAELAEGLGAAAGVQVRRSGAPGAGAKISVRGASPGQVVVLFAGVPVAPARGAGLDLDLIPPSLLGAAYVHRGGSALRFGQGAMGGALVLEPPTAGGRGVWAWGGAGSFGSAKVGAGGQMGSRSFGGFAAVDLARATNDFPFEDGQGTALTRRNADGRRLGLVSSVHWRPSEDGRLRVTSLLSSAERGRPGPSEFQEALDGARSEDFSHTVGASFSQRSLIESDALAVDLEVLGGHVVRSSRYTNPKRLLISRVGYDARGREQRVYGSAVASAWFDNGAGFLGADVTQDELRTVDTRVSGARERSTHERGNRGAFASGEVSVGPVSIHGGVRVESVEGIPGQWSPGGGVIAEVGGGVSVVGNVARAWRAPSFDELYLDQELLVGDPDLGPEEAVSADAGLRWELGGAVRVEAVAFWVDIDDTILFLPVSPSLFRAQNAGGAQSRGAEVTVLLRHDWWAVEAAYTLTDARFDAVPRDPLPGQPRHRVHGELRLLRPNVEFFGRVRARSEVFLDNFSNLRDEPVAFVDAGAVGEPLRGWKIAVLGRNLTDVRTSEDHLQQPLPGLSWHIQLSARVGE